MVNRQTALTIRKTHRYLGLFLGLQFLFWTISGLYFSWTDLDAIHGDHFKRTEPQATTFSSLVAPSDLGLREGIRSLTLRDIDGTPFYWINDHMLYNAQDGTRKAGITEKEALSVAASHIRDDLRVSSVSLIEKTGPQHEYRERLLPAYVISYSEADNLKAYVSASDGQFQTVRHSSWRIFDFLWMTHTMDYQGRDNFNTITLRAFSLLGFITVMSGFTLWFVSSPSVRKLKIFKRIR